MTKNYSYFPNEAGDYTIGRNIDEDTVEFMAIVETEETSKTIVDALNSYVPKSTTGVQIGTTFVEKYEGLNVSGRGIVVVHWKVVSISENRCDCKQIANSSVMEVNPKYIQTFTTEQILKFKSRYL